MEKLKEVCYMVTKDDNVATAMADISVGEVILTGDTGKEGAVIDAKMNIPFGHKIALFDIKEGDSIIKYGVSIGLASKDILKGNHIHMHNMRSAYDFRSAQLDPMTAHAKDIEYTAY